MKSLGQSAAVPARPAPTSVSDYVIDLRETFCSQADQIAKLGATIDKLEGCCPGEPPNNKACTAPDSVIRELDDLLSFAREILTRLESASLRLSSRI